MKKTLPIVAMLGLLTILAFAQTDNPVPAFNPNPPTKADSLPPILPKDQRWGDAFQQPYQAHAYELAEKIPGVLHQLPCYCYCDRNHGHKSLRTCYESTHAAHCGVCLKEAYYAYQQTKLKKTPKQIREGIIRGDWQKIDLDKRLLSTGSERREVQADGRQVDVASDCRYKPCLPSHSAVFHSPRQVAVFCEIYLRF